MKNWEARERKKTREYDKERDREEERKAEEVCSTSFSLLYGFVYAADNFVRIDMAVML